MATIDIICRDCGHSFQVVTAKAIKAKQKVCPSCRSTNVRQGFWSFLRNGSLSDPKCGETQPVRGYG